MKQLYTYLRRNANRITHPTAQFAVRKLRKGDKVTWLPMMKEPGLFTEWMPIVKIYDRYLPLPYEKQGGLSEQECLQHLEAYQEQIQRESEEAEIELEYIDMESMKQQLVDQW